MGLGWPESEDFLYSDPEEIHMLLGVVDGPEAGPPGTESRDTCGERCEHER